jgi:hypothetical protein
VNSGIIQQRATFVRARRHEIDGHPLKIELESSEAIRHARYSNSWIKFATVTDRRYRRNHFRALR